jgi:hypothetical protein
MTRTALCIGVAAIALLGAAGLYVHGRAPPSCGSEVALNSVSAILRDEFHLDSIYMTSVTTVSGGVFGDRRECSAAIAEIRGGVRPSGAPWREIRYRIVRLGKSGVPVITAELGGQVPLPPPTPSLWQRMLAYL